VREPKDLNKRLITSSFRLVAVMQPLGNLITHSTFERAMPAPELIGHLVSILCFRYRAVSQQFRA
jgi:hypothetical protein